MILPLVLVLLALLCAATFAYGTEPAWASYSRHGFELIIWSRRLQWPLIVTAIFLCVGLGILVISGRRRAWWFIGVLPVLALFYHRFTAGPAIYLLSTQDPAFVSADKANFIGSDDEVVGLMMDATPYAFPYSALFRSPVVVLTGREKPIVLLWSAFANRAVGFIAAREVRASDLEVVSTPANALLVLNTRLGQFINGITGRTISDEIPTGFGEPITLFKMDWKSWVALHPDTRVMIPTDRNAVTKPLLPQFALPGSDISMKDDRRICMVATTQPIAVPSELITDRPLNLTSGQSSILLVRINGTVRAFNRELPGDLLPRFAPISDAKQKAAAWVDSDTNSEWTINGDVVTGPKETHSLAMQPLPVEDGLYLNVMKYWYPDLHLATDTEVAAAAVVQAHHVDGKPTTNPTKRRRPKRVAAPK